jgi:ATP-dependent DNA helicase RecQ
MRDYRFNKLSLYGTGKEKDEIFWHSVFRNAMLLNYLYKDIEQYGVIKMTEGAHKFLDEPFETMISLNHNFKEEASDLEDSAGGTAALDDVLLNILKDIRRKFAKQKNIPPYVIFQDPSLEDMATQYPITNEDMLKIQGVSSGKVTKFSKPFLEAIAKYVEENEIERPQDFVMKQVADQSKTKVMIIKSVDKKIPLPEIARQSQMSYEELLEELYSIINFGTKLNLAYYINEHVDEYAREEIHAYFMEAATDDLNTAYQTLKDDDIRFEEIQLMRLRFLNEVAN